MQEAERGPAGDRVQMHLQLAYKADPRKNPQIRAYLDRGYRMEELQRLTDRDAIVVMARD